MNSLLIGQALYWDAGVYCEISDVSVWKRLSLCRFYICLWHGNFAGIAVQSLSG